MSGFILNSFTKGSGLIAEHIQGGAAVVAYRVVYVDATGRWVTADADALATMPVVGLATEALRVGQYGRVVLQGFVSLNTWTWTPGALLYASTVAGTLTETPPVGVGDVVQEIGIAFSATQIYFDGAGLGGAGAGGSSNTLEGETAFVGFDATKAGFVNYFLVDGVADDVQIQAAIDYVIGLGGGEVFLESGEYQVTATIAVDLTADTSLDLTISGAGANSFLNGATLAGDVLRIGTTVGNVRRVVIKDLHFSPQGGQNGIYGDQFWYNLITNCYFIAGGIHIRDGDKNTIEGNVFVHTDGGNRALIIEGGDYNIISNNIFGEDLSGGVHLHTQSLGNIIEGNTFDHIMGRCVDIEGGSEDSVVDGNTLRCRTAGNGGDTPIQCSGANTIISNNNIIPVTAPFSGNGIAVTGANCIVDGNSINGAGAYGISCSSEMIVTNNLIENCERSGINAGNTEILIQGNTCRENSQVGAGTWPNIRMEDATECMIIGNMLLDATPLCSYGIQEGGTADGNLIKDNFIETGTINFALISGASTKLAVEPFQFTEAVNGAIVTASPTGVDVDATTEAALAWGQLPEEVQQVLRLKIWGVATDAPIGAGGQMHLEVTFNAGASNATYNTAAKSWNVANFDGEEADYVADDVVHWVIERGDVGNELDNLLAGDSFEILAIWEVGDDPDGATDCLFRVLEVEYV